MGLLAVALVPLAFVSPSTEWTAPPDCPDLDAVIGEATRLGADVDDADFDLRGTLTDIDGGYELTLSIQTATGTLHRQLRSESCTKLGGAAALILAVALDPMNMPTPVVPRHDEPEPTPTPIPTQVGAAAESPLAPVSERPPSPWSVQPTFIAAGTLGRGISPGIDGRVQLGAGIDAGWLRAELLGFHAFARSTHFEQQPQIGANVLGWGGSMRLGPRLARRGVELALPIGVELAMVAGRGFGTDLTWRRADLAWGVVAAPGLRVRLGSWVAAGVDVEFGVAVRRPAFELDPLGTVYRTPRLGIRGGLRLEVRIPAPARDQNRARRRPT